GSSESTSLSALYQGMLSSYGVCAPPPAARYETRPPWFVVRLTSSCRSAAVSSSATGRSPMPSCESRKLRNVVVSDGGATDAAHSASRVQSPEWNVHNTSGGSAKL